MTFRCGLVAAVCGVALVACSPALDWRETRPEGSGLALLFPCRPDRQERTVRIDGADLRMQMHSCQAAGATFSLAYADAAQASGVTALVAAWRAAAAGNIGAQPAVRSFSVVGATPNDQTALLQMEGRLPDGRHVVEHAAFFVKGLRVYEVAAVGDSITADTARTFFASIRSAP